MIAAGGQMRVYVATRPVDFRKGHDGLAAVVQEMFGLDPFSGAAFVFRSKRADRIKLLVWDRTGMVLVHKRLEGGKFVWPQVQDSPATGRIASSPWRSTGCAASPATARPGPRSACAKCASVWASRNSTPPGPTAR